RLWGLPRRGSGGLSSLLRAGAPRRRLERPASTRPPAADREPRFRRVAGPSPRCRDAAQLGELARVPKSDRDGCGRGGCRHDSRAGRGPGVPLVAVRLPLDRQPRRLGRVVRWGPLRLRRPREGSVAPVSGVAAPRRRARCRPSLLAGVGAARLLVRADAGVVPRPLLAAGVRLRRARVVARPRPGPAPRRAARADLRSAHSVRTGAIAVARPVAGSQSTTAPSSLTPPWAVSKRTGMPVRIRWMARSATTPMTESWGPVMPTSVIAAVPPGRTRASAV